MPASQRSSAQPGVSLAGIADLGPSLKITLVKSTIGYTVRQKATAKALGLRKLNQTVVKPNNPQMRGMVLAIQHLVYVEGADTAPAGDSE